MKDFPLVVSYYTKATPYEDEVKNLIASLQRFGLEAHVEGIDSFGSWERNCGYKPLFLLQMQKRFNRPLFWVDADAVFLKAPAHLDAFSADIAVRINAELDAAHPSRVMSGSLYVNDSQGAERILKLWAQKCIEQLSDPQRTCEMWDQEALCAVLSSETCGGIIASLPRSYTCIIDHPEDALQKEAAVIGHYQASRRFKKIIELF